MTDTRDAVSIQQTVSRDAQIVSEAEVVVALVAPDRFRSLAAQCPEPSQPRSKRDTT